MTTAARIPHLIGPAGVTDCFPCHSGAPCSAISLTQ